MYNNNNREKAWKEYRQSDKFAEYSHHEFDAGFEAGIAAREEQIKQLKEEIADLRNKKYVKDVLDANKKLSLFIEKNFDTQSCSTCKNRHFCFYESEYDKATHCRNYAKRHGLLSLNSGYRYIREYERDEDYVPPSKEGIIAIELGHAPHNENNIFSDVLGELVDRVSTDLEGDNKMMTISVQCDANNTSLYRHTYIIKGPKYTRRTEGYPEKIQQSIDMLDKIRRARKGRDKDKILNPDSDKKTPIGYKDVDDLDM